MNDLAPLAARKFRSRLDATPIRHLMQKSFMDYLRENSLKDANLEFRLRAFMAQNALPVDLDNAELALYFADPDHPAFKAVSADALLFIRPATARSEIKFVIDAIKVLKAPAELAPWMHRSDTIIRLAEYVAEQLGKPFDHFDASLERQEIDRKMAVNKPSVAECIEMMRTMTNAELTRAYVDIMHERQTPGAEK